MVTTGPVTSNEILVTQQAQGYFTEAVGGLNGVGQLVEEWGGIQLSQKAMATTAGTVFAQAVGEWVQGLNDIKNTTQWMADQLGYTAQQLAAGNQQNTDAAAQLMTFQDSASLTAVPQDTQSGAGMVWGPNWSP